MKYTNCVELSINVNELKRIAGAYVEDSRRLNAEELRECLLKTEGQYTSFDNIKKQLNKLKLHVNPAVRIITPIFLKQYLLDEDDFMSASKRTEEKILEYEQTIIDSSNNIDIKSISKEMKLLKFVLDKAWQQGGNISIDEKNLIEEIRKYLNISEKQQNMLEAKSGRYPTKGNVLHSRSEIDDVRKTLQQCGLLFYIKNADNVGCDVIPEEIAINMRRYYGIEIKTYGYKKMIEYVTKIAKKQYLIDIIEKYEEREGSYDIESVQTSNIATLQNIILENVKPSNFLGGYSPRDGLDSADLSKWCGELNLSVSGVKAVLIERLLKHYDELREITVSDVDEREKYYNVYHELARRDLQFLRKNEIISKDLECEHLFEKATNYLFEIKLKNKPLNLTGTNHPDGKLSFNDKYILWDNKSKETPVNLKEHIAQFDGYIKSSDKMISVFMVIAPEFTENSESECVKYTLTNDTLILLITADELKEVAEKWSKTHPEESFNLGYFKQNGRFKKEAVQY